MIRQIASWTLASLLASAAAGAQSAPESFRGTLYDAGQVTRGTTTFFTMQIDHWGTEEEARAYLQTIKDKGQDALIGTFWDAKQVGWVKVGDRLGYHLVFARNIPTPEGRTVRAFTDRPLQFFELRNNTRSTDYPFGIIEIKFPAKGKGEGTLVAAASVKFDDQGQLEIEQYGTLPFKLLNIKAIPVKQKK